MPPKKCLPRQRNAAHGELHLEEAAAERVDAVTAEPLRNDNYIEIRSPDQTLCLFYKTSTLIRIAMDKGGFKQPPHFREPMSAELQRKIEMLENRTFRFESSNDDVTSATIHTGAGAGPVIGVLHRHMYFDQIMDEFYHLSAAEVYVCPVCYEYYVTHRYVPYLQEEQARQGGLPRHGRGAVVEYVDDTAVLDPLNVLEHMQRTPMPLRQTDCVLADARQDRPRTVEDADDWDSTLTRVVFRRARMWKVHLRKHHNITDVSVSDYRLRDVLCTYYNNYNQLSERKHNRAAAIALARQCATPTKQQHGLALTQQRYWQLNARYNRLRYNRVVSATEAAEEHADEVLAEVVLQDNTSNNRSNHYNNDNRDEDGDENACEDACEVHEKTRQLAVYDTEDDDFIVSDNDESDASTSSVSSGHNSARRRRRTEKRRRRRAEARSSRRVRDGAMRCDALRGAAPHEHCNRKSRSSSNSSDNWSSRGNSEDADEGGAIRSPAHEPDRLAISTALYAQGILAPFANSYDRRLSAEDCRFLEQSSKKTYAPSQLYDPIRHRSAHDGGNLMQEECVIPDWDCIGDVLENRTTLHIKDTPSQDGCVATIPDSRKLLVDDEDVPGEHALTPGRSHNSANPTGRIERIGAVIASGTSNDMNIGTTVSSGVTICASQKVLLLDDDEEEE